MLVELAQLSGREPHAHVLPMTSPDALYERMERNMKRLALEKPYVRLRTFPRKAYAELVAQYEPVDREEGFVSVSYVPSVAPPFVRTSPPKGKPAAARDPLPLFTS